MRMLLPLVAVAWVLSATIASSAATEEESFHVAPRVRQLFLEDGGVESAVNLRRVVHEPHRHRANPVLKPDTPWEQVCSVYGTALYDEGAGLFKLWYLTVPRERGLRPLTLPTHDRAPHTTLAAYAESKDGVHWTKPKLNQFPYDGSADNNLLALGVYNCEGLSVLHDPRDGDPHRRWKAVYWDHGSGDWEVRDGKPYCKPGPRDGFCVAFSPDGIHWTPYDGNPVIAAHCDTNQNVVYDARLKRYVAFSRFGMGRRLARSESADFTNWSPPRLVLECDEADGPATQIYGAGVDIYEGVYLAMLWIYREGGDGKIDTQLAASRDGIHWTRVGDRAAWLRLGADDSWEGGMVRSVERIITRGDQLYIYYGGVHGEHTGPKFREVARLHDPAIGLLTLRRDGFASLTARDTPGILLTKTFALPPGELRLNVDATEGRVAVEICDAQGEPIQEAGTSQIAGDHLAGRLELDQAALKKLVGQPVKLRLTLQNAALFSYWFE